MIMISTAKIVSMDATASPITKASGIAFRVAVNRVISMATSKVPPNNKITAIHPVFPLSLDSSVGFKATKSRNTGSTCARAIRNSAFPNKPVAGSEHGAVEAKVPCAILSGESAF